MNPLGSQLVGRDLTVLVLQMPGKVTDEWTTAIQNEVRSRLPRVAGAGLVLDFQNVELINSIGITCLLQLEDDCRRAGARMLLAAVPPFIWAFFKQVKLDRRFTAAADVDGAVQTVGA
ncbi:MAG: STAS domain-containing protein [Phycisphaerales bacterium]